MDNGVSGVTQQHVWAPQKNMRIYQNKKINNVILEVVEVFPQQNVQDDLWNNNHETT